jgi:hypothetical protein
VGARWARRCREGNAGPAGGRSAEPRASCARRSSHTEERRSKSSVSTVQPTDDSVSPPVWAAGVARRARRRWPVLREAWARCAGAACSPTPGPLRNERYGDEEGTATHGASLLLQCDGFAMLSSARSTLARLVCDDS